MSFKTGFIAVIGRPNVGKSTIINQFIGQKLNITSHRVQTTRHSINAINTTSCYQMIFVDTPGIHIGNNKAINTNMNKAANSSIKNADVILWLIEANKFTQEDALVRLRIAKIKAPVILCVNKIDKLKTQLNLLPFLQKIKNQHQLDEIVPLSAFNNKDIEILRTQILKYLPEQALIFDAECITDSSEKFIVAEFIREKLTRHLKKELPYDLTVKIKKYESIKNIQNIMAYIYVNKASQKNIVIGHKGKMLKNIGTEARLSIEKFLHKKVFLELWVTVSSGWTDDKKMLASLGYG